jgi:GTP-dependent phosphoenolpyruvate carboxykinase
MHGTRYAIDGQGNDWPNDEKAVAAPPNAGSPPSRACLYLPDWESRKCCNDIMIFGGRRGQVVPLA